MEAFEDEFEVSRNTWKIIKQILIIMLPSLLNVFLQEIILQINIIYAGKFNNEKMLDGIGLANTLISCSSMSITVGLSGVLETFVSQSYGSR